MPKFKQYFLNEKTFNIEQDVKWIYDYYFKDKLEKIQKGEYKFPIKDFEFGSFKSDKLKTKDCIMANKTNPVLIKCGIFTSGNFYQPLNHIIQLSFNAGAIAIFRQLDIFKISDAEKSLGSQFNRWKHEFTEGKIKATIEHELSHWLNDSLHNMNITKTLKKASMADSKLLKKIAFRGKINIGLTDYEIDAQVHSLKSLKTTYKDFWNKLTLTDITELKPSFDTLFNSIHGLGKKEWDEYMKTLIKRLNREKLLGKNMKPINYMDWR